MAASSPARKSAPRKAKTLATDDSFNYTLSNGTEITLPRFDSVKPGVIRKIRKLNDVDQFFTVLETLADEETLTVIDELDQQEFQDLQMAWVEQAGVDVGES